MVAVCDSIRNDNRGVVELLFIFRCVQYFIKITTDIPLLDVYSIPSRLQLILGRGLRLLFIWYIGSLMQCIQCVMKILTTTLNIEERRISNW